MRHVEAVHASVIVGVLPLATALVGALAAPAAPVGGFWACAALGSALVVGFAVLRSARPGPVDPLGRRPAAGGHGWRRAGLRGRRAALAPAARRTCDLLGAGDLAAGHRAGRAVHLAGERRSRRRLVGVRLRRRVFDVDRLLRLVPRPGPGRHGAREPGAAGAALLLHAVGRAAAGRDAGRGDARLRPGRDRHRVPRQKDAGARNETITRLKQGTP